MLLGPPPKLSNFLAKTLDPEGKNDCDPSDQKVKDPMEHDRSTSFAKSPGRRFCIPKEGDHCCTSVQTGLMESDQPGLEAVQVTGILDGLQSEKNVGGNQNSSWEMGSGSPNLEREYGEDSQRALASPKGHNYLSSHKGHPTSPNPGSTNPPRNFNLRSGSCPGNKRSVSPRKSRVCSSSPFLNNSGTENQEERGAGTEEHLRSPLARSYNADEVREYMSRQLVERKKKEREQKLSVKQAMEMRKKRLQEVYKKQKEALSKKTKGNQRGNSLAGGKESAKQENTVGAAEAVNDGIPVQGNTGPRDLVERYCSSKSSRSLKTIVDESGLCQMQLNYTKGPFHGYLSSKRSPLRLKDLEPHHLSPPPSPSPPPISQLWPPPLTNCEGEMSCKATFNSSIGHRSRQQRIEALCFMATALSDRTENEAKRLGVKMEAQKRAGHQGSSEGGKPADVGGFARADPASKLTDGCGLRRQNVPGTDPVASPRALSVFEISPTRLQRREEQQEAAAPKDKTVDNKPELEIEELMDKLLCSSSSLSESFLWSDSEPLTEQGLHKKPKVSDNTQPDEHKELVNKCADVQRAFDKADHQATRKGRTSELPFEPVWPQNRSLGRRTPQKMNRVQDGNEPSQAQKGYPHGIQCQPLASDSLETRNGSSLTGKSHRKKSQSHDPQRKCSAIAEGNYNHVSAQLPRSSGLTLTLSEKPSDSSRLSTCTRNTPTKEMGKEDPVIQRLAELMKQLQEETEQLSFCCKARSSLREDPSIELKRPSTINPITETTNYLRNNTRRANVETSLDGQESVLGTTHTSLVGGTLVPDILVEQSFWSLLPSESHWRQTMENNMKLQSGDNIVQNTTHDPFRKRQEAGTSIFGSPNAFSRFTFEMAQQYLKEEELRARHQAALFGLREKALREKTKTELAWLEHQKTHLRDKGQDDKMPAIVQKQREILMKLQQEKAEIRHLQNVYKAAHQERKLLLRQQQEIFRIHQTTTHLQCQLDRSAMDPRYSGMKDTLLDPAVVHKSECWASPGLSSKLPDQDEQSCSSPSASGIEDSIAMKQLKKMHSRLDERFLTKKEKQLIKRRRQAEDLLEWKHRLDAEELAIRRIEAEAVAPWSPQDREKGPGTSDPLTETDNWNNEESSQSPKSKKTLGTLKVVTSAADAPLDEQSQGQQNMNPPAASLEQMATIVLKPSEKTVTEVAEVHSGKGLLNTEPALEPTMGENRNSPLRRELTNCKAMMCNIRSEQNRQRREKLKMEEAELCRQLEEYDAFISKTQAELISDADINLILKPQIKTPVAAQHKPRMIFPWLQRSNILKSPAKANSEIFQPQDMPSKQGEKAKYMEKILKPQEITGSVDVSCPPGKSEIGDQPSHDPVSQLPLSSMPVDENRCAENQSEMLATYLSPESSGSSDIVIESSDSSHDSIEEILQYSDTDYTACNRNKNNGSSDDTLTDRSSIVLKEEGNVILSSKPTESLFGSKSQLYPNDNWDDFATKSTDNSLQTSAHHTLNNNTNLEAKESMELGNIQLNNIKSSENTKESWFGLANHSEKVSSFRASSNHQPTLVLAGNEILKPEREVDRQKMTTAGSPLGKDDNFCEVTAIPFSLRSSHVWKKSAALAHGQLAPGSGPRTAELISPTLPFSYMDDIASAEENPKDQDRVSLRNEAVQSPARNTLCANENLPSSLETNPLRSETVEEMALYRAGRSPVAEDVASKNDELSSLNDKQKSCGSQTSSPVLKESSCKEVDLVSVKGIGSSVLEEQPNLVEEISSIKEELLSSVEEDSMFSIKELNSPVDELMLYESKAFPLPDEADISFESEDFPPPPEEIILLINKELPSPIGENTFVRIEALPLLSVDNSLINKGLPSSGEKHNLVNTDDFTLLLSPDEERNPHTSSRTTTTRSFKGL
ncbi:uncharacterized protein LOC121281522 [Carcharodon carcharias]|uniref:uncharacterized protein LOC121281522 n=1 Tax=Carcharodon carcharias TaxID=13397 RepID=UPI001B7F0F48|nr:uncharacterized protein LOC121281522 [Carcharodon carcharias]